MSARLDVGGHHRLGHVDDDFDLRRRLESARPAAWRGTFCPSSTNRSAITPSYGATSVVSLELNVGFDDAAFEPADLALLGEDVFLAADRALLGESGSRLRVPRWATR